MTNKSRPSLKAGVKAAMVLAGLMVTSCAPIMDTSPEQVQASNPTVTYKYGSDQDLVQANQNAGIFCNRYQSVPRPVNFSNDPDGNKVVIFECIQSSAAVPTPQYNPNLAYNYRSDQELLDASRNAQTYCMNNGSQQVISNMTTNSNGTKTVTFRCSPR
jgi:hypothetical protein